MAETNNITSLNLTFKTDIKERDIELVDALTDALGKFGKVDVKDDTAGKLNKISDALKKFNEIEFEVGIGKNVKDLVSTLSMVENIRDITPYANRLKDGFDILADASASFVGNKARLSGSLGKGIGNLAISLKDITNVQDIVPYAEKIRNGFAILADASKPFENVSPTIRSGLGESVTGLVDAINKMDSVRDISGVGENLINGLDTIAAAVTPFNNINAKIGVTLGRGITGLVDAINQIRNVKDISSQAQNIENSFKIIATATRNFNGTEGANFSGIARLITTMTSVGNIKKIDDTVVENANKLVEAINILDKNTNQSSMRLSALSRVVDSVGRSMNTAEKSTKKFDWSLNLRNLTYVIFNLERLGRVSMGVVRKLYGLVDAFGDVQNTLSFFSNSLGSEAKKTAELIQVYSDFGAVNFSDFANQVAKLNQVYKGYGISSENAAKMALNMTQMAYDASFALGKNGKDIELWNQRVMSVATGQTRAGYYFGVDTSVKALSETFEEMDSNASKATRSIAAYTAMLENTKALQGQLAREYSNTYVQMDVFRNKVTQLKEAVGRALVPLYQSIIKWGLIALKVTERVIDALVRMFGGSGFELINYGQMIDEIGTSTDNVGSATDNIASGIKRATKAAKEFQKTITGIDQVFTINDRKDKDPNAGSALGGGIFDAPVGGYDWLDALASADNLLMLKDIEDKANSIVEVLKKLVPIAATVGAGFAGFKIAKSFLNGLKVIEDFKGIGGGVGLNWGLVMIGATMLIADLREFINNLKTVLSDPTFDSVSRMLSSFAGSMGDIFLILGNTNIGGALKLFQGLLEITGSIYNMTQVGVNWDDANRLIKGLSNVAIGIGLLQKNFTLVSGGLAIQGILLIIGQIDEIMTAIKTGDWSEVDKVDLFIGSMMLVGSIAIAMKNFKKLTDTSDVKTALDTAGDITGNISTATGSVSTKMVSLAKNLGLAVVIMAEVALGAIIFVGSIWAIGELLQKVNEAWKPVIADGKNTALAIGIGTGLLVGVGLAMGGIGTLGTTLVTPMAIGAGILAGLTLGLVAFIYELKLVADSITNKLSPSLASLNEVMPDLTENMRSFTFFMIEFAGHMVAYAGANTVSGLAATVDTIVGWFTKDPIEKMAADVKKNYGQFESLNKQLNITNPLVKKGNDLTLIYMGLLEQLYANAEKVKSLGTMPSIGVDFKEFSKYLKDGFNDLDKARTGNVEKIMQALSRIDLNRFKGIGTDIVKSLELGINNYQFNLNPTTNKIKSAFTFSTISYGTNIASGVVTGINNYNYNITSSVNKIKNAFTFSTVSIGTEIARGVVNGINGYSVNVSTFTNRVKNGLTFSGNSIGSNIAKGVVSGINSSNTNISTFTNKLKKAMTDAFNIKSPSRWARDVVGNMIGMGTVIGINDSDVNIDPFKRGLELQFAGISSELEIDPKINMPTLDTSTLTNGVATMFSHLNTDVNGEFDLTNDGTERAVKDLIVKTEQTNQLLQKAIDKELVVAIDKREIGKVVTEEQRLNAVRSNNTFK